MVLGVNPLTYSAVLFRSDCVARSLQIHADKLLARVLSDRKTPRRLRHRIYAQNHLAPRKANRTAAILINRRERRERRNTAAFGYHQVSLSSLRPLRSLRFNPALTTFPKGQ